VNVSVDDDRCAGHGVCTTICPEVFTLTDAGYSAVQLPEVPAEFEDAVLRAVQSCPERAITAERSSSP
jgi:ferredoxin